MDRRDEPGHHHPGPTRVFYAAAEPVPTFVETVAPIHPFNDIVSWRRDRRHRLGYRALDVEGWATRLGRVHRDRL
jgi:hypothetical protein